MQAFTLYNLSREISIGIISFPISDKLTFKSNTKSLKSHLSWLMKIPLQAWGNKNSVLTLSNQPSYLNATLR